MANELSCSLDSIEVDQMISLALVCNNFQKIVLLIFLTHDVFK